VISGTVRGAAVVSTLAAVALVAMPVATASPTQSGAATDSANMLIRTCSYVTFRCTGYRQTNPPYSPRYPSTHATNWAWVWI
jgi:hypothetical protein